MRIAVSPGWGDAVPGGYNGSLIAEHDGQAVGSIEYQTATGQPGLMTDQGHHFWEQRGREITETYQPPQWTAEPVEFDVADERGPSRELPEPEFDVEIGA